MNIQILHVDDSSDDAELARLGMTRLVRNLHIEWVPDGAEALSYLREKSSDCVICDYQMPRMNGLDLLRELRNHGNDIPFIFLTGQGNEHIAAEALRAGADDYYTKDIGFAHYERLINSIRRIVEVRVERRKRTLVERRLLQLAETAGDIIITHDLEGKILYGNKSLQEKLGYRREDLTNFRVSDVLPAEFHAAMQKRRQARLSGERGRFSYNTEFLARDGRRIPVEVRSSMLTEPGEVQEILIIARDVSDRQLAIERLRRSEERFRKLFEAANDAIFTMQGPRFIDCNTATLNMFGCRREDIVGETPFRFSPAIQPDGQNSRERAIELLDRVYAGESLRFPWRHKRLDGTEFDAEVGLSPLELDGDIFVLAIVRDTHSKPS